MVSNFREVLVFKNIKSTQLELIEDYKIGKVSRPCVYLALSQSSGIGSNGRTWIDANDSYEILENESNICYHGDLKYLSNLGVFSLFMSFTNFNTKDIPAMSASIYYVTLVRKALKSLGSKAFVKWPNDLYLGHRKIGGLITYRLKGVDIVGVGINQLRAPKGAGVLDIECDLAKLAKKIIEQVDLELSWLDVFKEYSLDFRKSASLSVKFEDQILSLQDARLFEDGSILVDNKRIYGLR